MKLEETIEAILGFASEMLFIIQDSNVRLWWRWFKKNFRKNVWRTYLLPLIKGIDKSWIPRALFLIALIRILLEEFTSLPEGTKALSVESVWKEIKKG